MKDSPFKSVDPMVNETAAALVQASASSAFQLFRNEQFRRLAGFEQLSQTEQDRIFNELVAAFVVLVMLVLEAPDLRVAAELQKYLAALSRMVPKAHLDYLREWGVEAEHLRDWEKLITMRYEEYARDRHDVRAAAMQIESSERELNVDGLAKIQMLVPLHAVAIGCHHHICRGHTEGRDDLFKETLSALSKFYVELRIHLEGGKITTVKRLRVALKHIIRRFRGGGSQQ